MPVPLTFHLHATDNWRVKRVEAVAAYSGAKIEEAIVDMAQTKEPEFLAKFPAGCVPAFESEDGLTITESAAIAEYGE
jgi:elongation factor 1-gamma